MIDRFPGVSDDRSASTIDPLIEFSPAMLDPDYPNARVLNGLWEMISHRIAEDATGWGDVACLTLMLMALKVVREGTPLLSRGQVLHTAIRFFNILSPHWQRHYHLSTIEKQRKLPRDLEKAFSEADDRSAAAVRVFEFQRSTLRHAFARQYFPALEAMRALAEQCMEQSYDPHEFNYDFLTMETDHGIFFMALRVVYALGDDRPAPVAGFKMVNGVYAPPRHIGDMDDLYHTALQQMAHLSRTGVVESWKTNPALEVMHLNRLSIPSWTSGSHRPIS